jgi:hypothetical protein
MCKQVEYYKPIRLLSNGLFFILDTSHSWPFFFPFAIALFHLSSAKAMSTAAEGARTMIFLMTYFGSRRTLVENHNQKD